MAESHSRLSGALMVVAAATAFSGKAVIIKLAYRYNVDAVTLLALRMIISAPMFALLAWWASRGPEVETLASADLRSVIALGFVGYYLASYFDFLGLQYVTAALERLLLFVHPTFVLFISAVLFKRRITQRDLLAVALSYLGIGLVFGNDVLTQPGNVALGSFWVLLSAVLYAVFLIGSGRLVHRVGSLRFASYSGLAACAAVVAHYLVVTPDRSHILDQPAPVYWLALLMAAVATVLPIVLTSEGIRRIGASHASIIASVGPIATIFLGFFFLGEAVTVIQLAGCALVMAGVLAITLHQPKPG
jgi:drug/metabolite transporter (DMT)-like permease